MQGDIIPVEATKILRKTSIKRLRNTIKTILRKVTRNLHYLELTQVSRQVQRITDMNDIILRTQNSETDKDQQRTSPQKVIEKN